MCTVRVVFLTFFLLISLGVRSADFYWIGQSADPENPNYWSYSENWSHTSGGTPLVDQLPGKADDVYFDVNSKGLVYLDLDVIEVRNFTIQNTEISFTHTRGYWTSISGNLKVDPTNSYGLNPRMCPPLGTEVKLESNSLFGGLAIEGKGTVVLGTKLGCDKISVYEGTFKSDSYAINAGFEIVGGVVDFGDSEITCSQGMELYEGAKILGNDFKIHVIWGNAQFRGNMIAHNFVLEAENTGIGVYGNITGNDYHIIGNRASCDMGTTGKLRGENVLIEMMGNSCRLFGKLETKRSEIRLQRSGLADYNLNHISSLQISDSCYFNSDIRADSLLVRPGAKLEMGNTCTTTVDKYFGVEGTEEALCFIGVWERGERTNLVCKAKAVVNYAVLRNVKNSSDNILKAVNSVDMGNNLRWEFEALPSAKFYHKGGSANWRELSQWFMDESFSQPAKRLPTAVDDVYMLDNETTISGDEYLYNACRNLTTGEGKVFNLYQTIHILGHVEIKSSGYVSGLYLFAHQRNDCFVSDQSVLWSLDMSDYMTPEGEDECWFDLKSDIHCNYYTLSGSLRTNAWKVNVENNISWMKGMGDKEFLDMEGSVVRCPSVWIYHDSILSAGSRVIVTELPYRRENFSYYEYINSFTVSTPQRDFMADRGMVCIPYDTIAWLSISGRATAESALYTEKLELLPDSDFSLREETYAKELLFGGKADSLVKIRNTGGISKLRVSPAGNHQVTYCLIDCVDVENATVQAKQSWLYSPGSTGWQIEKPESMTLYWIGGSGKWSDRQHWSSTSGGENKSVRMPMPGDKLVVDQNSALKESDIITFDLLNNVAGDLDIQVPCCLEMGTRGRKLNVSGDFKTTEGVKGQLFELWLWGKQNRENMIRLSGGVITDMIFQKANRYRTQGTVKTGYFIVYDGKIRVTDSLNLVCFQTRVADSVVLDKAIVDVADWRIDPFAQLVAGQTTISCYSRSMSEDSESGLVTSPPFKVDVWDQACFHTSIDSDYDRVKFYGQVNTNGFPGAFWYVAPYSNVQNYGEIKVDSVVILGDIQNKTYVYGGSLLSAEYAFFDGAVLGGITIPEGSYTAWFSDGVNSVQQEPFSQSGVQLIRGGHLCKVDSVDLSIPHVMQDPFEWIKDDILVEGSQGEDTLEIHKGGNYYCQIHGKLNIARSNVFNSIHERDFIKPQLQYTNDSVLCKLDHNEFNLGMVAVNGDSQQHLGFRWFFNNQEDPVGEGDAFVAKEEGCYEIEIYGYACRDTFPAVCTRWVPDVPDPSLLVSLGEPARHCPGESILIGVKKVIPGIDTLWYSWRKGEEDLAVNADTLRVIEDDNYKVTLHNICGATQPGITFQVTALTPPGAPWQDTIASRCGPGEVEVRLGGVKENTVYWYDEEGVLLHTGTDSLWKFPEVEVSGIRQADVMDNDHCVSDRITLELKIDKERMPVITVTGDTLQCLPDELFQVEMTASPTGTPSEFSYHWYRDGTKVASGENSSFQANEKGLYSVEIQGFACRNRSEESISLRLLDGPPDPALIQVKPVAAHCPGEEAVIELEPIPGQRDSVWIRWQKEGTELPEEGAVLKVSEDGMYAVNISNICGFSSEWKEIAITAVIPPEAPIQEGNASNCGPGDVTVKLQEPNTQKYQVVWMDENKETLVTGNSFTYAFPDVRESGYRYVRFQDINQCLSDIAQLQLIVFDVPVLDLGGDREVEYSHQVPIEVVDVPLEGTFQWSPCEKLDACDVREPLFSAGAKENNPYRLDFITPDGCLVSDSLMIHVFVVYRFPDMITPNGDGYNDIWKIHGLELCAETNELWIYDHTGKEVFHARPYHNDWDGKSEKGDELIPGSYIYKFTPDGELVLTGMVSLIRH